MNALFGPGDVVATPGALAALREAEQSPLPLLARHLSGDWGDLCPEDRRANDEALTTGRRLLSVYTLGSGTAVWVITDAADDLGRRPCTTFLLPEGY